MSQIVKTELDALIFPGHDDEADGGEGMWIIPLFVAFLTIAFFVIYHFYG